MDVNGWKGMDDSLISDEQRSFLAEIDGKRGFFKGIPLNTHLCYSNPEVRGRLVNEVIDYTSKHPEVDVMHFWLADDSNNICECENCKKRRLSDWYVDILNEIDEGLTAKGIKTKICFLVYLDLYWSPTNKIINEDRFILMFAPIFRSYCKAYDLNDCGEEIEYKINAVKYPHASSPYVKLLKDWQKKFKGDSFDFDYHLMWDINRDFGGETIAEVLYKDIRSLKKIGLNGFMSCQLQRAFYPSGFAFYLMGRVLFDGEISYEEIRKEYYDGAFGKYSDFASNVYAEVDRTVSFPYMREEISSKEAYPLLKESVTVIETALKDFPTDKGAVGQSLELLKFMLENTYNLVKVLLLKIEGAGKEEIEKADKKRKEFFNNHELKFQTFADGFYVNMIVDGIVSAKEVGIYAE
jgi:hypothetical protein